MSALKYTVIKTEVQYSSYCNTLEQLVQQDKSKLIDEIELLTLLIEKWDRDHNTFEELSPLELIKALMKDHDLKSKDLVKILGLSKGTVSKILNCQKGLSKETIRNLAHYFKLTQEAFNRPYPLVHQVSNDLRNAS